MDPEVAAGKAEDARVAAIAAESMASSAAAAAAPAAAPTPQSAPAAPTLPAAADPSQPGPSGLAQQLAAAAGPSQLGLFGLGQQPVQGPDVAAVRDETAARATPYAVNAEAVVAEPHHPGPSATGQDSWQGHGILWGKEAATAATTADGTRMLASFAPQASLAACSCKQPCLSFPEMCMLVPPGPDCLQSMSPE